MKNKNLQRGLFSLVCAGMSIGICAETLNVTTTPGNLTDDINAALTTAGQNIGNIDELVITGSFYTRVMSTRVETYETWIDDGAGGWVWGTITGPRDYENFNDYAYFKNNQNSFKEGLVVDLSAALPVDTLNITDNKLPATVFDGYQPKPSVLILPNSIDTIKGGAFNGNAALVKGANVITIDAEAMRWNRTLGDADLSTAFPKLQNIGNNAFGYCDNNGGNALGLTSVKLPATITTLGNCFNDCNVLSTIIMLSPIPPTLTNNGLGAIGSALPEGTVIKLYVPTTAVDAYKAITYFNDNFEILPLSSIPTQLPATASEGKFTARFSGDILYVGNLNGNARICVMDMCGRVIAQTQTQGNETQLSINGNSSVYLIQVTGADNTKQILKVIK